MLFASLSLARSFPLSDLPVVVEEPLDVRARGEKSLDERLGGSTREELFPGNDNRYHPPVYVNTISSYLGGNVVPDICSLEFGTWIHPTTHRSSSDTSSVGALGAGVEIDIWEDRVGMRYCAYDHSESKYLGNEINGASGEKVDCRLLYGKLR